MLDNGWKMLWKNALWLWICSGIVSPTTRNILHISLQERIFHSRVNISERINFTHKACEKVFTNTWSHSLYDQIFALIDTQYFKTVQKILLVGVSNTTVLTIIFFTSWVSNYIGRYPYDDVRVFGLGHFHQIAGAYHNVITFLWTSISYLVIAFVQIWTEIIIITRDQHWFQGTICKQLPSLLYTFQAR